VRIRGRSERPIAEHEELVRTVNQTMPYGRFKGRKLIDLPEPYLVWFKNNGFPAGSLGRRLAVMYEIKLNGLEPMLRPLVVAEPALDMEEAHD